MPGREAGALCRTNSDQAGARFPAHVAQHATLSHGLEGNRPKRDQHVPAAHARRAVQSGAHPVGALPCQPP